MRSAKKHVTVATIVAVVCVGGVILWQQQGGGAAAHNMLRKGSRTRTAWLQNGNPLAILDGTQTPLPVAPYIVDGRMMVPLGPLAEWFGATIEWEKTARAATITWVRKLGAEPEGGAQAGPQPVNGLQLSLSTPQTRYPAGSEFRLDIELKNVSDRPYRIWIPPHRFDMTRDEIDPEGRSVTRTMGIAGSHHTAAWIEDIVKFTAEMSITLPHYLGRNVPGTMSYTVTYSNDIASLKPVTASSKTGDIWTGSVTSNTVTVRFYDDAEQ